MPLTPGYAGFRGYGMGLGGYGMGMPNPGQAALSGLEGGIQTAFGISRELREQQAFDANQQELERRRQWEMDDRNYMLSARNLEAADVNRRNIASQVQQTRSSMPRDQYGNMQLDDNQRDLLARQTAAMNQASDVYGAAFRAHYHQPFINITQQAYKTLDGLNDGTIKPESISPEQWALFRGVVEKGQGPSFMQKGDADGNPMEGTAPVEQLIQRGFDGIARGDQQAVAAAWDGLLAAENNVGIGHYLPDGRQVTGRQTAAILPGPNGGSSIMPVYRAATQNADGSPGGDVILGHTDDHTHSANATYPATDLHQAFDFFQHMKQWVDTVNQPVLREKYMQGMQDPKTRAALQVWQEAYNGMGLGSIKTRGKVDRDKIDAGGEVIVPVYDEFGNKIREDHYGKSTDPKSLIDAVTKMVGNFQTASAAQARTDTKASADLLKTNIQQAGATQRTTIAHPPAGEKPPTVAAAKMGFDAEYAGYLADNGMKIDEASKQLVRIGTNAPVTGAALEHVLQVRAQLQQKHANDVRGNAAGLTGTPATTTGPQSPPGRDRTADFSKAAKQIADDPASFDTVAKGLAAVGYNKDEIETLRPKRPATPVPPPAAAPRNPPAGLTGPM